jgi:hypothetical protein
VKFVNELPDAGPEVSVRLPHAKRVRENIAMKNNLKRFILSSEDVFPHSLR